MTEYLQQKLQKVDQHINLFHKTIRRLSLEHQFAVFYYKNPDDDSLSPEDEKELDNENEMYQMINASQGAWDTLLGDNKNDYGTRYTVFFKIFDRLLNTLKEGQKALEERYEKTAIEQRPPHYNVYQTLYRELKKIRNDISPPIPIPAPLIQRDFCEKPAFNFKSSVYSITSEEEKKPDERIKAPTPTR